MQRRWDEPALLPLCPRADLGPDHAPVSLAPLAFGSFVYRTFLQVKPRAGKQKDYSAVGRKEQTGGNGPKRTSRPFHHGWSIKRLGITLNKNSSKARGTKAVYKSCWSESKHVWDETNRSYATGYWCFLLHTTARYNRSLCQGGGALALLREELVQLWPRPVTKAGGGWQLSCESTATSALPRQ